MHAPPGQAIPFHFESNIALSQPLSLLARVPACLFVPLCVCNLRFRLLRRRSQVEFGNDDNRTVNDRHGIRIVFDISGQIGHYDFQTLLIRAPCQTL